MTLDTDAAADADEPTESATIAARLASIRERVAAACERVGRPASDVTIVGVTKTKPASTVRAALAAGLEDVGENYVQEFVAKHAAVAMPVRWHFIGHVQRNKVRDIVPLATMIHSVDSERLARAIDAEAERLGRQISVLVQVNTSGEASKFGAAPDAVRSLAATVASLRNLRLDGLMTIAAFLDDPEALRPMFARLRMLRDELTHELGTALPHLSMGMTGDFETAIEEGATIIRIGAALFGPRG